MRCARIITLAATTALLAAPGPSARASAQSQAVCSFAGYETLTPGVTLTRSTFSFKTGDGTTSNQTVPIVCTGTIKGQLITGPGTYAESGSLTGDCISGSGFGKFTVTLQTRGGLITTSGKFPNKMYVGGTGTESGPNNSATFQYLVTEGNCVTAPVTQIFVTQQELITS